MAVVTTKSGQITNRDATPPVLSPGYNVGGVIKEAAGYTAVASGDSIASKYILCSVPSNARVSQVLLYCTAITTCAADIGVYYNTADGGAVVDADFFAPAQSLASALTGTEVTHKNVLSLDKIEQPFWQALGLSKDPGKVLDIVATLTAAAGSSGSLGAKVQFAE